VVFEMLLLAHSRWDYWKRATNRGSHFTDVVEEKLEYFVSGMVIFLKAITDLRRLKFQVVEFYRLPHRFN